MLFGIPSHVVVGCLIFNTHSSLCWTIQPLFRKIQLCKRNHAAKMYGKRTQKPFRNGPRLVTSSQDGIISGCIMVVQTILLVTARLQTPQGLNQHHLSLLRSFLTFSKLSPLGRSLTTLFIHHCGPQHCFFWDGHHRLSPVLTHVRRCFIVGKDSQD